MVYNYVTDSFKAYDISIKLDFINLKLVFCTHGSMYREDETNVIIIFVLFDHFNYIILIIFIFVETQHILFIWKLDFVHFCVLWIFLGKKWWAWQQGHIDCYRACGSYQDFLLKGLLLTMTLLNQGSLLVKLKSWLQTFYCFHHDLVNSYGIYLSQMTTGVFHWS